VKEVIVVDSRFHGPPTSGNGGYVCGLLARFIGSSAEITLSKPPPLDRRLPVEPSGAGQVRLLDGDDVVARGRAVDIHVDVPEPPTIAAAQEASKSYLGFRHHVFPTCFVCGPKREPGDGLRIFPGRLAPGPLVAAPWIPDQTLAGDDGFVRPEFLWAALDCPGIFAVMNGDRFPPTVLGQLAARIDTRIRPGSPCVVCGWEIGADGRKRYAGTALFSASGELLGRARATWIELRPTD
jgi:hypothetical protein